MTESGSERHAARLVPLVSAERIRLARESRGWNQRELVSEMTKSGYALSPGAVSQLENGKTKPSAPTLVAIAEATDFPLEYFVRRRPGGTAPGFFRSLRAAPARERRRSLARAHLLHDLVEALEQYVELPELDLPRDVDAELTNERIDEFALELRREWGLGDEPVDNVVRQIERHGAIVSRFHLERADLDAFSVWFPDRPIVVLGADKDVAARSRFDAAHELAHLLLHGPDDANTPEAEKQAHRFAAAFLLPADEMREVLPSSADWDYLLDLKIEWGASIASLLYRARELEVMTPARYLSAVKYMSARGWRKREPGDAQVGPLEEPRLIDESLRILERDGVSLDDLADEAGLPAGELKVVVGQRSKPRPRVDL